MKTPPRKRESYICANPRLMCLSQHYHAPTQCPHCNAKIHHIGTPEGGELKRLRLTQKHKLSAGRVIPRKSPRKLNLNIGEAAEAVAWEGGR